MNALSLNLIGIQVKALREGSADILPYSGDGYDDTESSGGILCLILPK